MLHNSCIMQPNDDSQDVEAANSTVSCSNNIHKHLVSLLVESFIKCNSREQLIEELKEKLSAHFHDEESSRELWHAQNASCWATGENIDVLEAILTCALIPGIIIFIIRESDTKIPTLRKNDKNRKALNREWRYQHEWIVRAESEVQLQPLTSTTPAPVLS